MISAFQYFRLPAVQAPAPRPGTINLARLLGLDGRLSCIWEEHLRATLSDSG
ncbi:MAG: hypothetical protein JSR47_13525 [Proteobacteria bacterium]|nr:hypothetical protein [Pseudomonadota bacterium]MBS0549226.1 hypothetical protein [Pseudomonadota bacterium]